MTGFLFVFDCLTIGESGKCNGLTRALRGVLVTFCISGVDVPGLFSEIGDVINEEDVVDTGDADVNIGVTGVVGVDILVDDTGEETTEFWFK